MPGFTSVGDYTDAHELGQTYLSTWRKTPAAVTSAGIWNDLSMSPGNPSPNYYASAPLVAATLNGATGIPHGGNVSPQTKHLKSLMAMTITATALPLQMRLLDYLLYYPFADMGTNDAQVMDNTVALPRYSDGQVMAVITNSPSAPLGLTFTFDYINQSGAAKTSPVQTFGAGTATGTLATTDRAVFGTPGPFLNLADTDSAVRRITGFTMLAGLDVGLLALVIVKPLANHTIAGIDAPVEVDYLIDAPSLPRIVDGAFLGLVACPMANLSGTPIHGTIETVWS